ncbi:MAG: hypothetical protein BCS36_08340 [Desulfovibrio sp. MES5]|nr:MAG: hypothetical protein BCS36_08340 [Desulfovibrio sp. MES5]
MASAAYAASAFFANSIIFDSRTKNGRKAFNTHTRNRRRLAWVHYIADAAALDTTHMLMPRNIAIKTFCGTSCLKATDLTTIRQKVQIAVNSSQTDPGQAFAHDAIELVRSWVRFGFTQLFQNHRALPGHSCLNLSHISLHLIVKITVTAGCCQAHFDQKAIFFTLPGPISRMAGSWLH